jgi:allantoin racemase
MRIWFQKHVVAGRIPALDRLYAAHLAAAASPGTEIEVGTLPAAAYDADLPADLVRFGGVEALYATHFMAAAVRAERAGFDAYVIGTSQDPGLREARALVRIPVIGYGETAAHLAAMTDHRFGFVGFIPALEQVLRENLARWGLDRRVVGFEYLRGGTATVQAAFDGDTAPFLSAAEDAARRLAARGAELLIPGEGLPNELLAGLEVRALAGVPVLDVDAAVIRIAELLAGLRRDGILPRSDRGYWLATPDAPVVDRLLDVFLTPRTPASPEEPPWSERALAP